MDELEKVLYDAGWNKETIDCFLKHDPVTPSTISMTTFDVEYSIDKADVAECPEKVDSSSFVFKVNN